MKSKISVRQILAYLIDPAQFLKRNMEGLPWYFSVLISGVAFLLLFLQSGLDMYRAAKIDLIKVFLLAAIGLFFGIVVIVLLALFIHLIAMIVGYRAPLSKTIKLFTLSYAASLIYLIMGLIFSLALSWNTSIAFGVTGILWTMRPLIATIKSMFKERELISVIISSLCGVFVIVMWSLINGMMI